MTAAGAGAGAGATTPNTYADYFMDMGNNPYHGVPTAVYVNESMAQNTAGNRIQPAAIFDTVGADPNPDAYLSYTVEGLTCVRSFVTFRLQKVPRTRAAVRSPLEGDTIANFGDLTSLGPTYVHIKLEAWRVSVATVPTVKNVTPSFANAGADPIVFLGSYATGDAGTDDVDCRKLTHIPYKYVAMALWRHHHYKRQ